LVITNSLGVTLPTPTSNYTKLEKMFLEKLEIYTIKHRTKSQKQAGAATTSSKLKSECWFVAVFLNPQSTDSNESRKALDESAECSGVRER